MDRESQEKALREYNGLYRFSNEIYHEAALAAGLSDSAFDILYCLYDMGDGCSQKDICEASYLTKQTVNSSVHKLVREGVVHLDTEGGRGTRLYLTKSGRALVEARIAPIIEIEKTAFAAMSVEECGELLRLMRLYLGQLREQVDVFKREGVR